MWKRRFISTESSEHCGRGRVAQCVRSGSHLPAGSVCYNCYIIYMMLISPGDTGQAIGMWGVIIKLCVAFRRE